MDIEQLAARTPNLSAEDAERIARTVWGVAGAATPLAGERDRNFRLDGGDGARYVLKISQLGEERGLLEAQNAVVERLSTAALPYTFPRAIRAPGGEEVVGVDCAGKQHLARLVCWVDGQPLGEIHHRPPALLRSVGAMLGAIDRTLGGVEEPALRRPLQWDARNGLNVVRHGIDLLPEARRALVEFSLELVEDVLSETGPDLREGLVHGDGNDWNVLVERTGDGELVATGLLDFGDMVRSWIVAEPAIAAAYAAMGVDDAVGAVASLVAGYHSEHPLTEPEVRSVWAVLALRLAMSVTIGARQKSQRPDDAYLSISQSGAWGLLERLKALDLEAATQALRTACRQVESEAVDDADGDDAGGDLLARRTARLGPSLSLAYQSPLHIVRGWMQYLYDAEGREYLDCVNNVAHVGHGHPRVVGALARQAAMLNTNTRYMHGSVIRLAERLTELLPAALEVCYFVCSGSEANELALRMARAHTGRRDVVVLDSAYHGNTGTLVEMSPYKFDGPGGLGRPDWVHVASLPDPYRGRYRAPDGDLAVRYATDLGRALDEASVHGGAAAFFAESLASCGGQVEYPPDYLALAYARARGAGAVCVADEVQVGFGRVGSHFWGFETGGAAVPDIVTMGKPMGNGHPVAAVVTTRAIADSFATGMEYFNTFGGNPVSSEVALAVLDVMDEEGLQDRALRVGGLLRHGLEELMGGHESLGDVRGRGLFLGVELVRDRADRLPDPDLASAVVEAMRRRRILLSTDGPDENVIKIKPPLQFSEADAERLVAELDAALRNTHPNPSEE